MNLSELGLDLSDDEDFVGLSDEGRRIQESIRIQNENNEGGVLPRSRSLFDFGTTTNTQNSTYGNATIQSSGAASSNECYTFAGIRINKARVTQDLLETRIIKSGRKLMSVTSVFNTVKSALSSVRSARDLEDLNSTDWVTIGVVVGKSETRSSAKGNPYCILKLTDLSSASCSTQTCISLFLFGDAFRELWKNVDVGLVIGVLNADVLDGNGNSSSSGESAASKFSKSVAISINTAQKVMILGNSRDYAVCRATDSAGASAPCWRFVNTTQGEFCAVHTMAVYQKFTKNRVALQLSYSGVQPRRFDVTNPQNALTGASAGAHSAANWKRDASQLENDSFCGASGASDFAAKRGAPIKPKQTSANKLDLGLFDPRVHNSSRLSTEDRALLHIKAKDPINLLKQSTAGSSSVAKSVSVNQSAARPIASSTKSGGMGASVEPAVSQKRASLQPPAIASVNQMKTLPNSIDASRKVVRKSDIQSEPKSCALVKVADGPGALNLAKFCLENSIQQHFAEQASADHGNPALISGSRKRKVAVDAEDESDGSGKRPCAVNSLLDDAAKLRTRFSASQFLKSAEETNQRLVASQTRSSISNATNTVNAKPKQTQDASKRSDTVVPKRTDTVTPKRTDAVTPKRTDTVTPKQTDTVTPKRTDTVTPKRTDTVIPKLGRGLSPSSSIEVRVDAAKNGSRFSFDADAALKKWKLSQIAAARETLARSNSQKSLSVSASKEKESATSKTETVSEKKRRLLELLERGSRHESLTKKEDATQMDRYFSEMAVRDRVEQRLLGMHKQAAKIFTCEECSYTSLSLFERCGRMRHRVRITDGFKYNFECRDCRFHFAHLSSRPAQPCERCGSSSFNKAGAIRERSGPLTNLGGESLVLRMSDEDYARPPGRNTPNTHGPERAFEDHDNTDD